MNKIDPNVSIPGFFAGQSVFITGATGFMGKVLVEKLLRSCPDIREIFMLMRPKRGMSIDDRMRKLTSEQPFVTLREKRPEVFEKLIPVQGDTTKEGLGLPEMERRALIDRVSIIYHGAASVRFDDSLKTAVLTNTRSTRDMCILAAQMKNLKVFCHISTTYCQADKPIIEEKLYQAEVDWKKTIKMCEILDENVLKALTPKYIGGFPNTYTFAKRLGEQVINDYSHVIPMLVFRPSVVISTLTEPVAGWLNNFNGPVGLLIGGGKGILRIAYGDPNLSTDYIPVDVATKAMIIATWKRGIKTITKDPSVHVYNCSSADIKGISTEDMKDCGMNCLEEVPLEGIIWAPRCSHTQNETIYFYSVLLFHVLPAFFIDVILWTSGRKPMLLNLQRRVYIANKALAHFITNQWKFKNEKLLKLSDEIPPADVDSFLFEYATFDIRKYFILCLYGAKKYLLKEDVENLEPARQHLYRMIWIDRVLKAVLGVILFWMIIHYGVVDYVINKIENWFSIWPSDLEKRFSKN